MVGIYKSGLINTILLKKCRLKPVGAIAPVMEYGGKGGKIYLFLEKYFHYAYSKKSF